MPKERVESWKYRLLRNTALGILIGVVAAFILASVLDSDLNDEIKKLYTFLITALLSLIAAALTLIGVFVSIENQQFIEKRTRERKISAARAFLPGSLSNLCEICRYGMRYSSNFNNFEGELRLEEFGRVSISQLSLSDEIISVFRDTIELTERDDVANRLSGLVREHQIFLARWRSEFAPDRGHMITVDGDLRRRTVSWAYLYAIAASVFAYARNEVGTVDTTVGPDEIRSAINTAGIPELHAEDFAEEIGLYSRTFGRLF